LSVVDVVVQRSARRAVVLVAGVVLGLLAFAADALDGVAGQVVVALVSSGLAWGLAALLAGRTATDRRGAMTNATALLVSATFVYYLLILLVSRRWSGGSLVDGLRSVAIMTTAWLLISVIAGPALGLLGHLTRTAPVLPAAVAAGVACGLLSGQGWQTITMAPPGHLLAISDLDAIFARGVAAATLIQIILPLAVLVWLAGVRRLWRAWPILLTALVVTATLSALCWHLLRTAANQFG
jgi:hypothetical protein